MGSVLPKQFLELEGVPVLRRTIELFLHAVPGVQVVTVLPEAHITYWRQYCLKAGFVCPQRLVKGGFTRFHSVKNALKYVPEDALVAVHDAVRPLASPTLVKALFEAAQQAPAVIPVLPVTDTLKLLRKEEGKLLSTGETLDRSCIFAYVTRVQRKGKVEKPGTFWWNFFEHTWLAMLPMRHVIMRAYGRLLHRKKR